MNAIRVGLVGCGSVAQQIHLRTLGHAPGVALVALAEPDPARRAEAARRAPGARAEADYRDVLASEDVDAVVVCLPNALHAPAAVDAFAHGKHVYLEKPLAADLDGGRRVLDAWRRAGTVGMVGFNYRFNPLYRAAREAVRSGRLGQVVAARSVFSTPRRPLPEWRRARTTGGGVLLDLASHHVDLMRFLFDDEVHDVSASVRSVASEADTATLHLGLGSGVPVQSFFSSAAGDEDRVEIYGCDARLSVDRYRSFDVAIEPATRPASRVSRLLAGARSLGRAGYVLEKLRAPAHEPSFAAATASFAAAVRGDGRTSPDLTDGYRALAVVVAAEESAAEGRVVALSGSSYEGIAG